MSDNLPALVLVRSVGWEEPPVTGGGFVLPSGTVTLLLGDVEGSTRAWEADPRSAQVAMVEMFERVDELVGRFDGVRPLEQGEGDSFVAAFARARDGVACAFAIQQALVGHPLAFRLAVHTGDVTRRDEGNYAGPTIIRTARLRNLAHGGQTVVSEATRELVADALPDGVALRDLGVHRLQDLSRAERVYQLCHPDLRGEFPALRSLDARPNNLPIQRTAFIGRAAEIAGLAALVVDEPLITVTGSGGCGKTRLALQVAAEVLDYFADGVWFVDMASVSESDGVAARAGQALGVLAGAGLRATDAVVAHLATASALVVLDNCEQVADAAAALVDAVLAACPGLRVMATSRQPLGVDGEIAWRVPSLSLPLDVGPAGIVGLPSSEAVELFIERASRSRPGFMIDERTAGAVGEICRRLDGIPLAIELAAARVRVLTPAQIASGLSERFRLLTGAARTALPRQQTLEASLDWSHTLLTEPERVVFRRLGVFVGSFDLDAATVVATGGEIEPWQVLDLLTLLVDKNLVAVNDSAETARYHMLETVRAYAFARLEAVGETDATAMRHCNHYLAIAELLGPQLTNAGAELILTRLDTEFPNVRAALVWSRARDDRVQLCRMVGALAWLWAHGSTVAVPEGVAWVDSALAASELASSTRAQLCWVRANLAYMTLDFATGAAIAEEGLRIARELDDDMLTGRCLVTVAQAGGYAAETAAIWEEAVAVARRAGDEYVLPLALGASAVSKLARAPQIAYGELLEALEMADATGNLAAAGITGAALGWLLTLQGRPRDALVVLDRAHRDGAEAASGLVAVGTETFRALAHATAGSLDEAVQSSERLSELTRRTGVRRDVFALQAMALVAAATGDAPGAVILARKALACATFDVFRAGALMTCAQVSLNASDSAGCEEIIQQIRVLSRSEDVVFATVEADLLSARLARRLGDPAAEDLAHTALARAAELPAWTTVVDALETLAGIAGDAHSYDEAARLFGAANTIREDTGYLLCITDRDVDIGTVQAATGQDDFTAGWMQGQSLSTEDALAYARRGRGERRRPTVGWASLTPTELQVVEQVREGRTNAEIGERLFVSPRTVQAHLTRIYTKLGFAGRTELAAQAAARRS
jgi:predicted ATPase/class 3 adenylate cyclase/DNA-binding CsgD family transcriptional regulator